MNLGGQPMNGQANPPNSGGGNDNAGTPDQGGTSWNDLDGPREEGKKAFGIDFNKQSQYERYGHGLEPSLPITKIALSVYVAGYRVLSLAVKGFKLAKEILTRSRNYRNAKRTAKIKAQNKAINITGRIKESGMTTTQAGRFFGWGKGTPTKGLSDFTKNMLEKNGWSRDCLLYTSPSPRDRG